MTAYSIHHYQVWMSQEMKMGRCLVKLCVCLFLAVAGIMGSELTINVKRNASVTLTCSTTENLYICSCYSYSHICSSCKQLMTPPVSLSIFDKEKYFTLNELKHSDTGQYACFSHRFGKRYRLNVLEDQPQTVVIGTVGQSIVMSRGTKMDIMAASQKHWCRLVSDSWCQPDTVMGPKNKTRGDFKILDSNGSFSLEKRHLQHNDSGSYNLTLVSPNQTTVYKVELQVKDEHNSLEIIPVQVASRPDGYFKIICQYSQELQDFSKSWLCDDSECPKTVKTVDDRFHSALELTIENGTCQHIRSFKCIAKIPNSHAKSRVYQKSVNQNDEYRVFLGLYRMKPTKLYVKAYSQLKINCIKPDTYNPDHRGRWHPVYHDSDWTGRWCIGSCGQQCSPVKTSTIDSLTLQICVTPNDNGTKYCCQSHLHSAGVEIVVTAPLPQPNPAPAPIHPPYRPPPSPRNHNAYIVIAVVCTIIVFGVCIIIIIWKGKKLKQMLFVRRTPLSVVDIHANMYANSVAHYYNYHHTSNQTVSPSVEHGEGENKGNSTSSEEEFEEWPNCPKTSSRITPVETEYVVVKGPARRQTDHANRFTPHSHHTLVGHPSPGCHDNREDEDEEDEITYTHVIIKPKDKTRKIRE